MLQGRAAFPWASGDRAQRDKGPGPDMEPWAPPPRAPRDEEEEEPQPPPPAQSFEGHGQVLLLGERWAESEYCVTLQDILAQVPSTAQRPGPSSVRAASGHSGSSIYSRRRTKRSRDRSVTSADCPAAKSPRSTHKLADPGDRQSEAAPSRPATPGSAGPASEGREPEAPPEPGARLLLVLCRAAALRSHLPRLQLLLQQVQARDRRPPAALVGIVVQPMRDEEAEARRRLEALISSAFAQHSPAVEVHTAVFSPGRPEGALDVQCARSAEHRVAACRRAPLVDRETQTDGKRKNSKARRRGSTSQHASSESTPPQQQSNEASPQQSSCGASPQQTGPGATAQQPNAGATPQPPSAGAVLPQPNSGSSPPQADSGTSSPTSSDCTPQQLVIQGPTTTPKVSQSARCVSSRENSTKASRCRKSGTRDGLLPICSCSTCPGNAACWRHLGLCHSRIFDVLLPRAWPAMPGRDLPNLLTFYRFWRARGAGALGPCHPRATLYLQENTPPHIVIRALQALGTAAVALGALGVAYYIIESL
ncbi:Spermatogenesis-associated protein 3 [Galemys pyrenaicus]|uniref:Spermatogenesis-associated protein 3 n=1 Tax=Galemys pyrenaicus TaxID=202257 RepID=A0A8J6AGG0_GALPY|nr:Spermatogenesis-associated protein 3 [Galemys pyrenaicus]